MEKKRRKSLSKILGAYKFYWTAPARSLEEARWRDVNNMSNSSMVMMRRRQQSAPPRTWWTTAETGRVVSWMVISTFTTNNIENNKAIFSVAFYPSMILSCSELSDFIFCFAFHNNSWSRGFSTCGFKSTPRGIRRSCAPCCTTHGQFEES